MKQAQESGLLHLVRASGYSWQGLRAAWSHEIAFRMEVALCSLMMPVGMLVGGDAVERALLVGSLLIVLITELLNSAVEAVVDRAGPEWNAYAKRAKDLGSAAVFMSVGLALLVWGMLIAEKLG
ncbi:diacylglycerol kinase [Magnetococcus marinus MC-1]|uniref:Diacylglycerol kinase n=1 Tax=Magnetococcus marinus (strain ATCC BAA-1437 / JCM 17883 / MC-1) TaxID=156889 RepID=A0L9Z8_MAGMM|nr:diacylglycerol kinase [Magnetococcus marinus MC-1]